MAEGGARAPLVPLRNHQPQAALGRTACAPPLRPATAHHPNFTATVQHPNIAVQQQLAAAAVTSPTPAPLLKVAPTPRTLVLRRTERHDFGFTLRHFIIYPPDSVTDLFNDARLAAVGAVKECMDTIFVKSVREGSPAQRAGLRPGDRLISVDRHPVAGWPYARVVQLIQQASHTLSLQVVPKEADVLQKYFSEAAYNPETNQRPQPRPRERRISAGEMPLGLGLGAGGPAPPTHPLYVPQVPINYRPANMSSSKLLNEYNLHSDIQPRKYDARKLVQKNNTPIAGIQTDSSEKLYSPIVMDVGKGTISRLVDVQNSIPHPISHVSRRSSEGARLPAVDPTQFYASPPSSPNYSSRDSASYNSGESLQNIHRNELNSIKNTYPNQLQSNLVQNRLPLQYTGKFCYGDRHESNNSLTSSITDSKDSMSSRESMSTVTGNEQDNLNILSSRMRKSFEQKEAFLMRPCQPTGWVTPEEHNIIQQKEFYARPQKLHKPAWPPVDYSPSKNKENIQENCNLRTNVKSDESDHIDDVSSDFKIDVNKPSSSKQKTDKVFHTNLTKIQENSPTSHDSSGNIPNGTTASSDSLEKLLQEKRYPIPNELQIVSNRTKQFESLPTEDRTAMYRSELARLSTKKPEPTVALRRKEFESRGGKRDARSLDAQHSLEESELVQGNLSGNCMVMTGSKHLTCPPPEDFLQEDAKILVRLRSNSAGSEGMPTRKMQSSDGSHMKRRLALNKEQMEALMNSTKGYWSEANSNEKVINATTLKCHLNEKRVPNGFNTIDTNSVHKIATIPLTNVISVTDAVKDNSVNTQQNVLQNRTYVCDSDNLNTDIKMLERPTQLNLIPGDNFIFSAGFTGMQALGSSPTTPSSPPSQPQSPTGLSVDDSIVVRRQKKSDLGTETEGAMRRVSYLKATAEQYNFDHENVAEQALRSDKKDREEFREATKIDKEDAETGDITIEGNVQIKMVLTNSKRASDRSWKHAHAVLQGSKLTIYRHYHHQSPTASGSSESLNLQFSMADLAGDYTKRKHVVRVTSGSDGTELLLQAGSADEAMKWLNALQTQASKSQITIPQKPSESPAEVSGLSPPPRTKKHANARTISPTDTSTACLTASPKSKTWKGRVAKQLRRMQTGATNTSPLGTPTATIKPCGAVGVPLEQCEPLLDHPLVPQIVGLCTQTVEDRGLHVVGLYRIPGNTASVSALIESLEKSSTPDLQDARWNDVNVVSSLLKAFFRRLPNPLLTKELYPMFIQADKLVENSVRINTIRRLIRELPDHHYETLKFLMEHLKKVAAENAVNKMEARNLAIVFGPTLVRSADDNMFAMVNDMSSQCRIIESLITHMEWYFDEDDRSSPIADILVEEELQSTPLNQALLLQNVKKIEGKMDVSTKDIVSSIISAANRKIQRKPRSKHHGNNENSPHHSKTRDNEKFITSPDEHSVTNSPHHISKVTCNVNNSDRIIIEKSELNRKDRKSNDWHDARVEISSPSLLTDTVDASAEIVENKNGITGKRLKTDSTVSSDSLSDGADMVSSLTTTFDQKLRSLHSASPLDDLSIPYVDECHDETLNYGDPSLHRSTDILNSDDSAKDVEKNKLEFEKSESKASSTDRFSSASSDKSGELAKYIQDKITCDKITKEYPLEKYSYDKSDIKTKNIECESESEKDVDINSENTTPDNITPDNNKDVEKFSFSENVCNNKNLDSKTIDSPTKIVPLEIVFKKACFATDKTDIINVILERSKLKRSESLNRDTEKQIIKNKLNSILSEDCNKKEKNEIAINNTDKSNPSQLRRSVSLNRSDVKLKRNDSLTKTEKTETNLLRRKEVNYSGFNRASAKLKRKNGMPERSIKRRHTVGGTKDFDKDEWVALNCSRTSSPDLPTAISDVILHRHIAPIPLESHV